MKDLENAYKRGKVVLFTSPSKNLQHVSYIKET